MLCFGVGPVVLHGHVEIFVGAAPVALFQRFHALGQVGLGDLREVDRAAFGGRGELRVVLFAAGGIRQHVHRLGQGLEAALGIILVGVGVAVGMILTRQAAEALPDLLLGCRALDPQNFVIVHLHSAGYCFWLR